MNLLQQIEKKELIDEQQKLSKRQQKKLLKREKQKEHFKEKKQLKKQQLKEKKLEIKLNKTQESNQDNEQHKNGQIEQQKQRIKRDKNEYKELMREGITVIIDLQFLNQMTDGEKTSLYKQIELCHSINFKSTKPLNLIVTSIDNDFMNTLNKSNGQNWGIQLEQQHYLDLFKKEQLIYLTGDTQDTIENISKEEVYIIGGLVDHNRLKMITYNKAQEQGIRTKRLPINVDLKTSAILTVNQVFEILLRVNNDENWDDSILNSIPRRKLK